MRASLIGLAVLMIAVVVLADHGHWTDNYKSADGILCCTHGRDCDIVRARILKQEARYSDVEIDGITYRIPNKSIHPSEDLHDWFCRRFEMGGPYSVNIIPRCLFIAAKT